MNVRATTNSEVDVTLTGTSTTLGAGNVGAPPRTLSDIPGLGPIRVRALQKAGWSNLSMLRSADLETLLTVPGLTEIKARHIQQFLASFAAEDLVPPATSEPGQSGSTAQSRSIGP